MMQKKEINELLKNKEIKKLFEKYKKEIKNNNKLINESMKKLYKIIEEAQKNRAKFEKQLKQFKKWLHFRGGLHLDMVETDYKSLSIDELVKQISPSSPVIEELTKRGVIRNRNYTGNIGEYFAIDFFNNFNSEIYTKTKDLPKLIRSDENSQDIDAKDENGKGYSIKTITKPTGTTGSFWNPESIENNEEKFSYLLIVILDKSFQVDKILELDWENFMKNKRYNKRMRNYNISVTNKLREEFKIIYKKI